MTESFDFDELSSFATGTEGPVGQRVFYLQAIAGDRVVSLRLEKQQVALLAESIDRLLQSVELAESMPAHMPELREPVVAEWIVGEMMLAVDDAERRVIVIARELELGDDDGVSDDDGGDDDEFDGAVARFALTRGQAEAFVDGARRVVIAGRPLCPLCGRPQEASGHFCPRLN